MKIQNKKQLHQLARAVNDYYMAEVPPANKVVIPLQAIRLMKDEKGISYVATVRTEVNWTNTTVKQHKVNIKFALTPNGKLDSKTLEYL